MSPVITSPSQRPAVFTFQSPGLGDQSLPANTAYLCSCRVSATLLAKQREGGRGARAEGRGSGPQPLEMPEQGWEEGGESPGTREPGAGCFGASGGAHRGTGGSVDGGRANPHSSPTGHLMQPVPSKPSPSQPLNPPPPQASSHPLRWPLLGAQGSCQPQGQPRAPLTRPWVSERPRFKCSITSGRSDALPLMAVICVQGVTPRAFLSPWC